MGFILRFKIKWDMDAYMERQPSWVATALKNAPPNSPPVKNSPYDGSVSPVKYWLREHLKDPDSVQYIDWSNVKTLDDGQHAVLVKYRAKNSFGGYVIEQRLFVLDSKGVVAKVVDASTKRVVYKR
jgi:hypothetical protein